MTRAELGATLLSIACAIAVIARAASSKTPPPKAPPDADEQTTIASAIAAGEREWRSAAIEDWPSDRWSQRDDFHYREAARMKEVASEHRVSVESVLRAVDRDVHLRGGGERDERGARAVPCKPRPVYD